MDVKGAISLRQYKNNLFSFVICFLFCCNSIAQSLEGYWEGAIIRTSNSIQLVKLSVFIKSDSLYGAFEVNDWPYFENDTTKLAVEGNVVKMQTPYGKASFVLDTNFSFLKIHSN